MNVVAIIPGLVAIYWLIRYSYREAYLDVYLFSMFLLPGWCHWVVPALPDPSFDEAALLPIFAAFLLKSKFKWRFSLMDVLVLLYATHIGYSEYTNAGFKEAQNLMFDMFAQGVFPYVLAKGIIEPNGLRAKFVKRVVWLLAILLMFFLYEAKVGYNPFRMIFDKFFPGQGDGWVTTFRYGLARTAGPYGHAILAGIVLMVGLSLARWGEKARIWEPRFKKLHFTSLTKARILTLAMALGLVLTMVRGPQIGSVIALVVTYIGGGVNPRMRARWVVAAALLVGIPAGLTMYSYASVGRAAAKTTAQESAAYRKELIDKYVDITKQHALIGWGRNGWPKVPGMPSIDNYYLLLALMHGVTASALLLTILLTTIVQLLRNGFKAGPVRPRGASLSFCLAGIFSGLVFAILTVFIGGNVVPIFFTMIGFADGYLRAGGDLQRTKLDRDSQVVGVEPKRFAVVFA